MTHISQVLTENVNGSTFISLDTKTAVKLKGGKKNPLQGRVNKVTLKSNVMLFQNMKINGYNAMVKRRLQAEGRDPDKFKLSPRVWGVRLPNSPLVEHKGNHYLEVIFLNCGEVYYEVDGIRTHKHMIEGLPETPQPPKQGEVDNKVIIRVYKLDSITKMTVNKNEYIDIQY
jgi:hypothetical protein